MKIILNENMTNCFIQHTELIPDLTEEDVYEFLKDNGVVAGIIEEQVSSVVRNNDNFEDKILVAKATLPMKGENGDIKYLVDDNMFLKKDERGRVDFYDVGIIKSVEAGQKLLQIFYPTRGNAGQDVMGNPMPGLMGDDVPLNDLMGENVTLDETEEYAVAIIAGCYKKKNNQVNVVEKLDIAGNMNFSVGNFKTAATVVIKGDIKYGFSVKTEADLQVDGVIEDSTVDAGENLICKSGIVKGVSPIRAGSSIRTKYITNRENVFAKEIHIESSVFSSVIYSEELIQTQKLSGGITYVRGNIVVEELGNDHHMKTSIIVGFTSDDLFEMAVLQSEMLKAKKAFSEKNREVSGTIILMKKKLARKEEEFKGVTNKLLIDKFEEEKKQKYEEVNRLKQTAQELKEDYLKLKDKFDLMVQTKEEPENFIRVKGTVYPNVEIHLNATQVYKVQKKMHDVVFKLNEEKALKPFSPDGQEL